MSRIAVQSTFTLPTRAEIVSRLAASPPIEELLTADDVERGTDQLPRRAPGRKR